MEIKKLISVFEKLLPIYHDGFNNKRVYFPIDNGLCLACLSKLGISTFNEFSVTMDRSHGYYRNLVKAGGYLFPNPKTYKDLKLRIDFMESEIKDLKRLLKKGYTHV